MDIFSGILIPNLLALFHDPLKQSNHFPATDTGDCFDCSKAGLLFVIGIFKLKFCDHPPAFLAGAVALFQSIQISLVAINTVDIFIGGSS